MAPVDTHDAPLQALAQSSQQHESTTRSQVPSFIQVSTSFFSKCSAKLRAAIAILVFTVICLLFGRLLFILIGVIGGVLLHAWWEELNEYPGLNKDDEAKRRRRKLGIEIAETVLGLGKFSTAPLPNGEVKSGSSELPFGELNPTTAAALENLVDVVINDYVR